MTTINFGKYKGTDITDVPTNYLEWGIDNLDKPEWRIEFEDELERRNRAEKEQREKIKANIHLPETLEFLIRKYVGEINKEISNSGCEWEYDNFNIEEEAEKKAREELSHLGIELAIDSLKKEFDGREGLNLELLDKIESYFYNNGYLDRKHFSTEARYQLAKEYIHKLQEIRGY